MPIVPLLILGALFGSPGLSRVCIAALIFGGALAAALLIVLPWRSTTTDGYSPGPTTVRKTWSAEQIAVTALSLGGVIFCVIQIIALLNR